MEPREFFIEDRLEKFRLDAFCNLGESGIRNKKLENFLQEINFNYTEFLNLTLDDSPNRGRKDLREKIASLYNCVSPDEVLITTGTSEALFITFQILCKKNTKVSLFTPAFQALYEIPKMLGAKIQKIDVQNQLNIKALFDANAEIIIINHPHNPTGKILSESDIQSIQKKISKYSGHVIFDEHYRFLNPSGDVFFSGANLAKNTITTGSVTKCFGVMGLKIGWLIAEKKFLDKARSYKDYLTHTVSPITEFLTLKLLEKRKSIIKPIKKRLAANIRYFEKNTNYIFSIEKFQPPEGGVVSFAKLKKNIRSEEYCDKLYAHTGVFVLPGKNFEQEGFLRIGFGEDSDRFKRGIDRWIEFESKNFRQKNTIPKE